MENKSSITARMSAFARAYHAEKRAGLIQALCQNPRPGYQHDPTRRYGFLFSGFDVRFTIDEDTLRVVEVAENACEPADI